MNVEIEVALALDRALAKADVLFDRLDRARIAASQISVNAANIRLPNVTGGGTTGGGSAAQSTNQINALSAAIARQRATAQTAWQATAQMNATISASVASANAATAAVNALAAAQARQAAAGQQNAAAQNQQAAANNNLLGGLVRLAAGYISIQTAFNFTKDAIAQSIAIENLTNTMTATSGSAQQAASDLSFLRAEAQRIGVSFLGSSQEFVKFGVAVDAAGMSSQFARETFTALSEASRRMGLTNQQQASTFLALEQMISKGTVSAQELRLQLGNALPGALQIAARSMGLTTKELMKMVESGNLASSEFLPKFITQLQKELPATAETLASTSAELARLGNQWQEFKSIIGEKIPVKEIASGLSEELQRVSALMKLTDIQLKKGDASVSWLALSNQDKRLALSQKFPQAEPVGPQDIRVRQGFFGTVTSGGPDWQKALIRMQQEQVAFTTRTAKEKSANEAESSRISGSDTIDPADTERARNFWKTYRQLEVETLGEEQSKREEIIRRYAEAIAKIRQNRDGFSAPMVDELVSLAGQAQTNQLNQLDIKEQAEQGKRAADNAQKMREEFQQIQQLQLKLIPDEEARKIALVNAEFDELRNKLLLLELGNPSAMSGDWEQRLEAARSQAVASIRTPKSPVGFLSQDFGQLRNERQGLMSSLATESDVEQFRAKTQQIQEINQAMAIQLRAGNVGWQESFTFGIDEVVEHWGSASERMANVGATLAESIQSNMTDGLTRAILETDNAQQAFADMTRAIVADLLKIAIQELFVKQIVGGLGGLFGTAAHTGAVLGQGGMTTQFAPRFHSGGPVGDEQLFMGRRGEVVFTPEQMKMLGGSQKSSGKGVEILNFFDVKLIDQHLAANPDLIFNAVSRRKGAFRALLQ